jgi:hypothetical protein
LKNLKKQQQNRAYKSPLLTEELLEKLMLAKTKDKNLWKFYRNPFSCFGRVMDNETVSSLYCIALFDNYIALFDNYIALNDSLKLKNI